MADKKNKIKDDNILTIQVKVKDKIEAYAIVSELSFDYEVKSAKFNGHKEEFNDENKPVYFLKDNSKIKKEFRDIRAEREIK